MGTRGWAGVDEAHYTENCSITEKAFFGAVNPSITTPALAEERDRVHAGVGQLLLEELLYKPSTAIYMQNLTSNKAVGHQQHHCLRDFLSQAHSFHGEFVFRPLSRFAALFS